MDIASGSLHRSAQDDGTGSRGGPIESFQEALDAAKAEALRLLVPIYVTTHLSSTQDIWTVSRAIGADQIHCIRYPGARSPLFEGGR